MLIAWNGMTEAQATVIAALLTIIAAVAGVWLGARLFSGKVKDIESAVQETGQLVQLYQAEVTTALADITNAMAELRQTATTTVEGIGQLRGAVGEIPITDTPLGQIESEWPEWDEVRDDWHAVRDELERRAADPNIDGRTRAKYGRIDRRRYSALIDAMDADGNLRNQGDDFRIAHDIWQTHKSGKRTPSAETLEAMDRLRRRLVRQPD